VTSPAHYRKRETIRRQACSESLNPLLGKEVSTQS